MQHTAASILEQLGFHLPMLPPPVEHPLQHHVEEMV
jgi:hypothetical protein